MSAAPCLTIDVEDFYEGMATLGHVLDPPARPEPGLAALATVLADQPGRITTFVVGRHAEAAAPHLRALAAAGHEIASHGPDHGRLPDGGRPLVEWLRSGREMVEDAVGAAVAGFRSPRFDLPAQTPLHDFRAAIAEAGFDYVSDTHRLGAHSAVAELPVTIAGPSVLAGGSYQRLVPTPVVTGLVRRTTEPCVLYYHSYDFGHELPALASARSPAVVSQVLGRGRIGPIFRQILATFGSQTCQEALHAVR